MSCLVNTPELEKLASQIPGETVESIKPTISLWQEKNGGIDKYPNIEELKKLVEQRNTTNVLNQTKKEENIQKRNAFKFAFDPQKRRDRAMLIAKIFSAEIKKARLNLEKEYNYIIENSKDSASIESAKEKLANLNTIEVINFITPKKIFDNIKKQFKEYVEASDENRVNTELLLINKKSSLTEEEKLKLAQQKANYKKQEYIKLLDNFDFLLNEVSGILRKTELISVTADAYNSQTIKQQQANEEENLTQDTEDNYEEKSSTKEKWMYNFRQISNYNSLSQKVRYILNQIPKLTRKSKYDKDDLDNIKYLDGDFTHAALLDVLKDMTSPNEMIPLLKKAAITQPWIKQVIKKLEIDSELFTLFYKDFRKDFTNFYIQKKILKSDDTFRYETISINSYSGIWHLIDKWRDTYEQGELLSALSVYNIDGNYNKENAQKGVEIITELQNILNKLDNKNEFLTEKNLTKLHNLLKMIGINEDISLLEVALQEPEHSAYITMVSPISNFLKELNVIFSGIAKGKLDSMEENRKDLITEFDSAFTTIAQTFSDVSEEAIESSVSETIGGKTKTYYSHTNPNYLGKIIKRLKNSINKKESDYKEFLQTEYKRYERFYKNGEWRLDWIEQLEQNLELRKELKHKVLLAVDGKEYSKLNELDYTLALFTEYNAEPLQKGQDQYAWYAVPILADSPSAEFLRFKKYKNNIIRDDKGNYRTYQDIILDKLVPLIMQEYDRIMLVRQRDEEYQKNPSKVSLIANYDIIRDRDGNITNKGGSEFKYFPSLNNITQGEKTFADLLYDYAIGELKGDVKDFIKSNLSSIIEKMFEEDYAHWKKIGLLDKNSEGKYLYLPYATEKNAKEALQEYYWNTLFATSQIIQITTTDLAYYKSLEDFQKRFKEIHAPSLKLNTEAVYKGKKEGREYESTIYLKDFETFSNITEDLKEVLMDRYKKGEMSAYNVCFILSKYGYTNYRKDGKKYVKIDNTILPTSNVNVADAQAYRSLSSYRSMMIMSGQWTDAEEQAYKNLKENTWDIKDLEIIWQTQKPFVYTQIPVFMGYAKKEEIITDEEGNTKTVLVDDTSRPIYDKVPVQHKNSEFLLLVAYNLLQNHSKRADKLKAIDSFMEEYHIDVVQFESAVKVGKKGVIDINQREFITVEDTQYTYSQYEDLLFQQLKEGKITRLQLNKELDKFTIKTEKEVLEVLKEKVFTKDGKENLDVVHKIPYEDYGIQVENPEHAIDHVQLIGTQIRKLITADISENAKISINGKTLTKKEWLKFYNEINTENIIQSFIQVNEKFSDPKEIEKILHEEIRGNERYSQDLLEACTYNEETETFNIPLYDPVISTKIQNILNSYIRNHITKQKIKGGAVTQVTSYGLNEDLQIKFTGEGEHKRIEYVECYMPAYTKKFFEAFMKGGSLDLDIEKLPEDLRKLIGYRVPTEDKYSMLPLRIKGFLPPQNGSAIMLPIEITTISGSDFDIDKLYIMLPEASVEEYNIKQAYKDFEATNNILKDIVKTFKEDINLDDILTNSSQEFKEWFNENKEKYKLDKPKFKKIKYDYTKPAKDQSKTARNNALIDLMWGVLTNEDTLPKLLNPGTFESLISVGNIISFLENNDKEYIENLFEMPIEEVIHKIENNDAKILSKIKSSNKKNLHPLSPTTQTYFHKQNMTGGVLIGIYANHNANHAMIQHTELTLNGEGEFYLNGKNLTSLHNIKNSNNEFISKNNAAFLAASVDNVKTPVLATLNQNTFTADVTMLLSRLGYTHLEIGLLMKQPFVVELTEKYFRESVTGKKTENIIEDLITIYKKRNELTGPATYLDYKKHKFSITELARNIITVKKMTPDNLKTTTGDADIKFFYENQLAVAYLFKHLLKTAESLSTLNTIMKADTGNGGVGSNIAETHIKLQKIRTFQQEMMKENFPFNNANIIIPDLNIDDIEVLRETLLKTELPFIQAFYTLGLESSTKLLQKYFPYNNPNIVNIITAITEYSKKPNLDAKTINSIYNDFLVYYMSKFEFFSTKTIINENGEEQVLKNEEVRDYYINKFPEEFEKILEENPDIAEMGIIKRLKTYKANKYVPVKHIKFKNVGNLSSINQERFCRDWESLLYMNNSKAQELAYDLFKYNYFRNGFAFGPSTFIHLSSTILRENIPQYKEGLERLLTDSTDFNPFIFQYFLNHLDNRKLVSQIAEEDSHIVFQDNKPKEQFIAVVDDQLSNSFIKRVTTAGPIFYDFIAVKYQGGFIYYTLAGNDTYIKIDPLGNPKNFLEYEYGQYASSMKSVIKEVALTSKDKRSNFDIMTSSEIFPEDALGITGSYFEDIDIDQLMQEAYRTTYKESPQKSTNVNPTYIANEDFTDAENQVICGEIMKTY